MHRYRRPSKVTFKVKSWFCQQRNKVGWRPTWVIAYRCVRDTFSFAFFDSFVLYYGSTRYVVSMSLSYIHQKQNAGRPGEPLIWDRYDQQDVSKALLSSFASLQGVTRPYVMCILVPCAGTWSIFRKRKRNSAHDWRLWQTWLWQYT